MKSVLNVFFGPFGAERIARERSKKGIAPVIDGPKKGVAFCEGCRRRKPIKGKSMKGWRCADCKAEKRGQKTA